MPTPSQSQSQSHSRKSSLSGFFSQHTRKSSKSSSSTKHQRTHTAPDPPTLSRLPSAASTATAPSVSVSASSRSRRASNPSTPTAPVSASSTTSASASYFAPQPVATGQDPRSPGTRRPPASHSGHGIDNSRGPPVTLVTRGNSDIARRSSSQKPADFAYAQQQFVQSGLVSPGSSHGGSHGGSSRRRRHEEAPPPQQSQQQSQQQTSSRLPSRRGSTATTTAATATATATATSTSRSARPMTSSVDDSSEYESGPRSQAGDIRSGHGATDSSSNDDEQTEDLFLNIAADTAPAKRPAETPARIDRLKSRLARVNDRQSQSSGARSPAPATSSTTPTTTRIASTAESRASGQRRPSLLPTTSRTLPERSSPSPAPVLNTPRTRPPDLSHKPSFSRKDAELSPRDFLAQFQRRPSQPETLQTPPQRSATYRPSNLYYSSSRDDPRTLPADAAYETTSRPDGTESIGSTGPAASVWDELDELKTRIRKIEMGGKMPATSGAAVSQASADRPRTANTSATTVSSSPNQQRKGNPPSEGTVESQPISSNKIQPLLRDALAKARQSISPSVYRILEATASEALTLAEMSGSAGPQGTLHSASSILGGSVVSDRQVRRKADNICRSLTELCIAMCDTKTGLASPAVRTGATISRRPSVQINGDSPTIRQSIEPESNTLPGVSPSRALSRIEARRTSQLAPGASGSLRNASQDPYDDRDIPSRLSRAGTSLHRTRGSFNDEEEEPTMRAPSRAMTDFRNTRSSTDQNRFSSGRQYTSREPMPELQPSPAIRPTSALRRPTVSGIAHESSLLYRDAPRRYELHRESSPAYEKQAAGNLRARAQLNVARNPNNRNSIGGMSDLGRSVSLGRRLRGSSIGE